MLELLVAIALIGVFTGVLISSGDALRKNGRDSQRQADLRIIQGGLQEYFLDQAFYPDDSYVLATETTLQYGPFGSIKWYLRRLPKDPLATTPYFYRPFPPGCGDVYPCRRYCIYAILETLSTPSLGSCSSGAPPGYNFAVKNP